MILRSEDTILGVEEKMTYGVSWCRDSATGYYSYCTRGDHDLKFHRSMRGGSQSYSEFR